MSGIIVSLTLNYYSKIPNIKDIFHFGVHISFVMAHQIRPPICRIEKVRIWKFFICYYVDI